MTDLTDFFGDVISSYSRAEMIEDGFLVDVTETAREAGFRWPTGITRAAWDEAVEWDDSNLALQDEAGRLWDCLWLAACTVKRTRGNTDSLGFEVLRVPNTPRATVARKITLKLHIGPGDTPEPVMTVMLPEES